MLKSKVSSAFSKQCTLLFACLRRLKTFLEKNFQMSHSILKRTSRVKKKVWIRRQGEQAALDEVDALLQDLCAREKSCLAYCAELRAVIKTRNPYLTALIKPLIKTREATGTRWLSKGQVMDRTFALLRDLYAWFNNSPEVSRDLASKQKDAGKKQEL